MTNLKAIRKPTQEEKKSERKQFHQRKPKSNRFKIYGANATNLGNNGEVAKVLGDNVEDIEQWRNGNINIK